MNELIAKTEALGRLIPRSRLHEGVVAAADSDRAESVWCVAFSGGADSLGLLLLLWAHWPVRREGLRVLHFNHRLRGPASDADREYCREVCSALGVAFQTEEWAEAPGEVSEAEARNARRNFFARAMEACSASTLWTGHQKDDIAETQLMRLARGSSSAGLAAPRPIQLLQDGRRILRPLLTLGKAEIVEELQCAGIGWRDDASNATGVYFRNRIRRDVLPVWRAAAENDALNGAALTRVWLEEDDNALDAWLVELLAPTAYSDRHFDGRGLQGKPRALWRRALRRWRPVADLSREGFAHLIDRCERNADGRMSVEGGWIAIAGGVLRFEPMPDPPVEFWSPATFAAGNGVSMLLPDGAELSIEPVQFARELRERVLSGGVERETHAFVGNIHGPFTIRPWMPGDRYEPVGAPGSAKLQDLFVNRKIPAERRRRLPVICAPDGSIVWVPGFAPASGSKVTVDSVTGVHLTYHPGTYTVRA